ncbi:hypothetical protein CBL_12747 [Carabus blaptoides fortunei]
MPWTETVKDILQNPPTVCSFSTVGIDANHRYQPARKDVVIRANFAANILDPVQSESLTEPLVRYIYGTVLLWSSLSGLVQLRATGNNTRALSGPEWGRQKEIDNGSQ